MLASGSLWLKLTTDVTYVAGTAQDVSFLIDFLPSYLFPNDERTISQWICAGKSLGGHSTWIVLKNGTMVLYIELRTRHD